MLARIIYLSEKLPGYRGESFLIDKMDDQESFRPIKFYDSHACW